MVLIQAKRLLSILLLLPAFNLVAADKANPYPDPQFPGNVPEKFAEGLISIDHRNEFRPFITPDYKTIYFSVYPKIKKKKKEKYTEEDKRMRRLRYTLMKTEKGKSGWSEPKEVDFSKMTGDLEPSMSPDGKRLYFTSHRKPNENDWDSNIWMATLNKGKWGNFTKLPFNTEDSEWYVTETNSGRLYLSASNLDKRHDIFVVDPSKPDKAEMLKGGINTPFLDFDPYVDPDEKYMIYCSDRPDTKGNSDLYISHNLGNGVWSTGSNLGELINTKDDEFAPYVSPDKKYLFFNRRGELYWVSMEAISHFIEHRY